MKIIVDILHPADIHFFRNALRILKVDYGVDFELIALPRHGVIPLLEKEYRGMPFTRIGKYESSIAGKVCCLMQRTMLIMKHLRYVDFDVVSSFGSYGIAQAAYFLRKPSVIFTDDIEYKFSFYSFKPFSTRIVSPCQSIGQKMIKYRGFKELAYLHPNYFAPNEEVLAEYDLKPSKYVFLREVTRTMDCRYLPEGQLASICHYLSDMGLEVVLSLENKSLRDKFEGQCIILKEPVSDIHSLLHYASLTVSSGGTMVRESCLLGTPAIYTGRREMSVNRELENKSCLFRVNGAENLKEKIKEIIKNRYKDRTQRVIREAIQNEWDDTTKVIVDNLLAIIR